MIDVRTIIELLLYQQFEDATGDKVGLDPENGTLIFFEKCFTKHKQAQDIKQDLQSEKLRHTETGDTHTTSTGLTCSASKS